MGNSGERQSIWYGNDLVGWRGQNFLYGREGLWRRGLGWVTWGGTKHDRPGDHKTRWLSREQRNVHRQPAGESIAHIHGIGNKRFQKRQLGLGGGTLATRYTCTLTSRSWLIHPYLQPLRSLMLPGESLPRRGFVSWMRPADFISLPERLEIQDPPHMAHLQGQDSGENHSVGEGEKINQRFSVLPSACLIHPSHLWRKGQQMIWAKIQSINRKRFDWL